MKGWRLHLAVGLLGNMLLADEPNTLSAAERAAGWKLLFDGKTLSGWVALGQTEAPAQGWTVADGALCHAANGGGGDIVTVEAYRDFELTWEWQIAEAGNSGVKYNLPNSAEAVGFEYQMVDAKNTDALHGGPLHQTASLYDLIAPAPEAKMGPAGEWNQSRILLDSVHVEHWLNGLKTVEFQLGSNALAEYIARSKYRDVPSFGQKIASPILLQDHGDAVTFRSIKLRQLPARP